MLCLRIKAGNSRVCTHPKRVATVLENAGYNTARHAIPLIVTFERTGCRIELVKAVLSSSPKGPRSIEKHRVDVIIADAGWIFGMMSVHTKCLGLQVKTMKAK